MKTISKALKKIIIFALAISFLGGAGVAISGKMAEPVEAATAKITNSDSGYYVPAEIVIKKGEKKTVTIKTPSRDVEKCNIAWSYNPNYVDFKVNCFGTYWGDQPNCTFVGKKAGSYDMNLYITRYSKKGGKEIKLSPVSIKSKITVVDNTVQKATTTTTTVKRPLQKIALNKTSASLTKGGSLQLSVSYTPSNTTDSKVVQWSSNNTAIATVSGGRVTAKKQGTATITAKVGTKTATCRITVQDSVGTYKNVSEAYTLTNSFRTSRSNQWYWNSDNRTKTYTYGLKGLTRDVALENIAKQRAKEQWTQYYQNGVCGHTRPNGKSWLTAYPASVKVLGENLSFGRETCRDVILNGWAETNLKYANQGHRRNMLHPQAKRVGIACYQKDGKTCWAMSLGW